MERILTGDRRTEKLHFIKLTYVLKKLHDQNKYWIVNQKKLWYNLLEIIYKIFNVLLKT